MSVYDCVQRTEYSVNRIAICWVQNNLVIILATLDYSIVIIFVDAKINRHHRPEDTIFKTETSIARVD